MTPDQIVEAVARAICVKAFGYETPMTSDNEIAQAAITVHLKALSDTLSDYEPEGDDEDMNSYAAGFRAGYLDAKRLMMEGPDE